MKLFGKTQDRVTDRLLRAYVSRPATTRQDCPDFDADLANAYAERALPASSRSRFEAHLAECAPCRHNVVALSRLAEAEAPAWGASARGEARSVEPTGFAALFRLLSRPQWAIAAAGVIVLAISLPVLLSSNRARNTQVSSGVVAEQEAAAMNQKASQAVGSASASQPDAVSVRSSSTDLRAPGKPDSNLVSMKTPAPQSSDAGATAQPAAEESQKLAAKSEPPSEQPQTKSETQPTAPAPAQAGGQANESKNEGERARQQGKDSALASEGARADEDRASKEKARKAEEVAVAPPPPASGREADRSNRPLRRGRLALRDGETESVRPPEKKLYGKKFLFRDATWIDKDYNPDKNLPVVTIIYDSNVYKEVLAKRAGLKPYLTGFSGSDRAIIVYKGTVYKLIPQ